MLEKYSKEHPRRENTLSAWLYLEKIYEYDSLFSFNDSIANAIRREKIRIKNEDAEFLSKLPIESYVSWYLPMRKLISSVSIVAQNHPEELPYTIEAFRSINYKDNRLYKSGLLKDAIESQFWLLENSGLSLDSVFIEMKISIDLMMKSLLTDSKKLNEVTEFLFDLLERHSLFNASEYLALNVLNEKNCTIETNLARQLEIYRAMKKGNTASDIFFHGELISSNINKTITYKKLSDIKSEFILMVFGASWCPKCKEEIPEIGKLYSKLKTNGVEVLFISLDDNQADFKKFVKPYPFLSFCDFKKWEGDIVKDYYVFATPTMFLLNKKREIILRPISVKQIDAWADWKNGIGSNE